MAAPAAPTPGLAARLAGRPLAVLLDVDGTLAPIAPRPEAAALPPETRRVVAALAARPGVHVALVSGRSAADARRLVGVADVWVVGNHGCEVASPDGDVTVDPRVGPYRAPLARAAERLRDVVAHVPGALVEDKVWTLSLHYRLADPAAAPRLHAAASEVARALGLRLSEGKAVLELRPPVPVNKGTAVLALAERLGALGEGASLLFAGDDRTDEDVFGILRERAPHAVTVRVADEDDAPSSAEFVVRGTEEMRALLEWVSGVGCRVSG